MIDPNSSDAVSDGVTTLMETVTGYRAKLEATGFSRTTSESMAKELHSALIVRIFGLHSGLTIPVASPTDEVGSRPD